MLCNVNKVIETAFKSKHEIKNQSTINKIFKHYRSPDKKSNDTTTALNNTRCGPTVNVTRRTRNSVRENRKDIV